jgi:hypothetical protein
MDKRVSVGLGGGTPECLPADVILKYQDIVWLGDKRTIPGTP